MNFELSNLIDIVKRSLIDLDPTILEELDEHSYYSHQDRSEIIGYLDGIIRTAQKKGVSNLKEKPSECKYCFPISEAFSFHCPDSDEMVIRLVMKFDGSTTEGERLFTLTECKNRPIPDSEDDMPF